MMHKEADIIKLRYIYIIHVNNRGKRSTHFGHKECFYTGQTNNIVRRFKEELTKRNSIFIAKHYPNASLILVYVHQFVGTEYDALEFEFNTKRLNKEKKLLLIKGEENHLIKYVPLKAIILKDLDGISQICLRL